MYILKPQDLRPNEHIQKTGHKGNGLLLLQAAGLNVPPWFCVSADLYKHFLEEMLAGQPDVDIDSETGIQKARQAIRAFRFPEAFLKNMEAAVQALSWEQDVFAVRSSALLEDTKGQSFAGQYYTGLSVKRHQLTDAIRQCWLSAWSPHVIRQIKASGRSPRNNSMAVIVQQQIHPDYAGVLFTQRPTSEKERIIEYTRGSGDKLVSGEATPTPLIYNQNKQTFTSPGRNQESKTCSIPDIMYQLVEKARIIDQQIAPFQDVEWAAQHGSLYFLQTRPITAPPPPANERNPSAYVWTSWFFDQRFPNPITPLNSTVVCPHIFQKALKDPLKYLGVNHLAEGQIVRFIRGRIYTNLEVFKIFFKWIPSKLIPPDFKAIFPHHYSRAERKTRYPRFNLPLVKGMFHLLKEGDWLVFHNLYRWKGMLRGHYFQRLTPSAIGSMHAGEIVKQLEKEEYVSERFLSIHRWSMGWAELLYHFYKHVLRLLYPGKAAAKLSGFDAGLRTITQTINCEIEQMAYHFYASGAIVDDHPQTELSPMVHSVLDDFFASHGHRAYTLDIGEPRWEEDPVVFFNTLVRPEIRKFRHWGKPADQGVKKESRKKDPLARLVETFIEMRESQRYHWEINLYNIRLLYACLGEKLQEQGVLEQGQDIFFLYKEEVMRCLEGGAGSGLNLQVDQRRAQHRINAGYEPAAFLEGDKPIPNRGGPGSRGDIISGRGLSPGRAKGMARVVTSVNDLNQITPGEILVARSTDPSWSAAFDIASGLIMERGGYLSHGAILAREYNLPAISQVKDALQHIHTGDRIILNAGTGEIRIEKPASREEGG